MKLVVIGGNASGMSGASRTLRKGKDAQVIVFEKTQEVSYGACGLPYYIGDENDNINLIRIRPPEKFREQGIDLRMGHTVSKVDPAKKIVTVTNAETGETFEESYDKLLISSGASPIVPNIPGKDLDGVCTLKSIGDAEDIKLRLSAPGIQNVVIVGGGYIGIELAEACTRYNIPNIHMIEAAPQVATVFDPEFGEAAKAALERHNVKVHTDEMVSEIKGDGKVSGVVTNKGQYDAEIVIMSVGVRPNTQFIDSSLIEMLPNGAIVTDEDMKTSIEDVFAAGDCSTVLNKITGKPVYLPLGTNANKQGRLVGDSIIGKKVGFKGVLGTAMLRCCDLEMAATGLTESKAKAEGINAKSITVEARTHARYYPGSCPITIKFCYNDDTKVILGAQLMGNSETAIRIGVCAMAVDQGMTASELGFADLGYAPPFSGAWDAINVAANAIK